MQRISVDFPEPEGPQTTTRSPGSISSDTALSAWNSPKVLDTSCTEIRDSVLTVGVLPVTIKRFRLKHAAGSYAKKSWRCKTNMSVK
jgi:hypothetical protein